MNDSVSPSVEAPLVSVTAEAKSYIAGLIAKQDDDAVVGVRMFVNDPGTPRAETCIAYCRQEDLSEDGRDERIDLEGVSIWLDGRSLPYLAETVVDYANDRFGGQLTIKAPNSRTPKIGADSPLEDRINYLLYNDINPSLASHGGEVSLAALENGDTAVLRFGGGCQGCGMVDVTLKDGVERALLEELPELKAVRDVTDHSDRSSAYY